MNTAYIFDVDGTLTPSRSKMDPQFADQFIEFAESHDVYLVTGSDYPKTVEQVGQHVIDAVKIMFSCCGNESRAGGDIIYRNEWSGTPELLEELEHLLQTASYDVRTGQHIEMRQGLINFSVIGRGATKEQRARYVEYDTTRFERRTIAASLSARFPMIEFAIAGETGIDIYPLGRDKSQVLQHIPADETVFFGDMIRAGGNDWGIAQRCTSYHAVTGWEQTMYILQGITDVGKSRL